MNLKIWAVLICASLGMGAAQAGAHHTNGANHPNHGGNGGSQFGSGTQRGYLCRDCNSKTQPGNLGTNSKKHGHAGSTAKPKGH
jgi:hypothetical protein